MSLQGLTKTSFVFCPRQISRIIFKINYMFLLRVIKYITWVKMKYVGNMCICLLIPLRRKAFSCPSSSKHHLSILLYQRSDLAFVRLFPSSFEQDCKSIPLPRNCMVFYDKTNSVPGFVPFLVARSCRSH